ncbi:MAG: ADP-forming succinate--CoA ligase subunit beta [Deltaproteobacteria bacterium]|nr:ADP-forming succinate--CoA ligase subunit beta [Deltaproteobacteria bacterium]
MYIHEYQAKGLLNLFNIPTLKFFVAHTSLECLKAFDYFGPIVIKAQVLTGGRGKAGGIRIANTEEEVLEISSSLLGSTLTTHQTGDKGVKVFKLLCEPIAKIKQELYLSFVFDRKSESVIVIFSSVGGVEIEELAKKEPSSVRKANIDPSVGFTSAKLFSLLNGVTLTQNIKNQLIDIFQKGLNLFFSKNLTLLEMNPLAILEGDIVVALDCKMNIDDNALFRHPDLALLEDYNNYDPIELKAKRKGLSYVALDGNIGCMVNGAGLAMATMDAIQLAGGKPANFLDVGGGVSDEGLDAAINLLLEDPRARVIFINIFGGIVRCDLVASSVIKAYKQSAFRKPTVIRLLGTNYEIGHEVLKSSEFEFKIAETLEEGAGMAVDLVR